MDLVRVLRPPEPAGFGGLAYVVAYVEPVFDPLGLCEGI